MCWRPAPSLNVHAWHQNDEAVCAESARYHGVVWQKCLYSTRVPLHTNCTDGLGGGGICWVQMCHVVVTAEGSGPRQHELSWRCLGFPVINMSPWRPEVPKPGLTWLRRLWGIFLSNPSDYACRYFKTNYKWHSDKAMCKWSGSPIIGSVPYY